MVHMNDKIGCIVCYILYLVLSLREVNAAFPVSNANT